MRPFTVDDVVFAGEAACVVEASVDKPGNVGPSHDFEDTTYLDFLLSGVSLGGALRRAGEFGLTFSSGNSGMGRFMYNAVGDGLARHKGRNTNLGMVMLLLPMAASAGLCIRRETFDLKALREGVVEVIKGSTHRDTLDLYKAIRLSNAEVGRSTRFDVHDPRVDQRVVEKDLNLYDVLSISTWDSIANELVNGLRVSSTIGYPALINSYKEHREIRKAVLTCFFTILSKVPDTLIERKNDKTVALEISREAAIILDYGMPEKEVVSFDHKLRVDGNRLNPGTTADLTASSLMIVFLDGLFTS